jgi:signal transduction histidine kinase
MRNKIEDLEDSQKKDELLNEADHMLVTFNALLRISRIESERQRSHFKTIDIKALLEDVIEFYEPLAEERHIEISVALENGQITGDRDLLFQAYANILDNALKFTPSNGKITITLENKENLVISIADTGDGLDPEDIEKIFDRFYRADKSRNTAGTGLGLSLVKAVIELHDGKVFAEDNAPGLKIITVL